MVHQSKSNSLRTIKESKQISEYMNTKSVDPGVILRHFVDKAVSCDDTTKRSSRRGVWNPLWGHSETQRYKQRVIKVLLCLFSHDQSVTHWELVYICRKMLTNWTEEEPNINHKSWKLILMRETSQIPSQEMNHLCPHKQEEENPSHSSDFKHNKCG